MNTKFESAPIKLSQAGFLENTLPNEIQVLKTGTYFHQGREIPISSNDLKKMVFNFNEEVRGIDLMLDFGHDTEGEAAAWFESVYLSEDEDELWARVRWTESGRNAVLSKKYRYISADFDFNYKDNETLTEHGPTLFGAGLTNRPVVKRMQAIVQLSESNKKQGVSMDLEKKVGEMAEMLSKLMESLNEMKKKRDDDAVLMEALMEKMGAKKEMGEHDKKDDEKELAENDKKEMAYDEKMSESKVSSMMSENARLVEENKRLQKEQEFNKLFSEGKVVQAQKEFFMKGDMIAFSEAAGKVNTENSGTNYNPKSKVADAEKEVLRLAESKMKDTNLTFGKAVSTVLSENPALAKQYRVKFN